MGKTSKTEYEIFETLHEDLLQSLATPKSVFIVASNAERTYLNFYLRQLLNPSALEPIRSFPLCFRPNDRFIVIKNDYILDIFNGMTGTIVSSTTEDRPLLNHKSMKMINYTILNVIFDRQTTDKTLVFPTDQLSILFDLGYVITVHKAQGSEYENVIVSLPEFYKMITREFLYTAFSRSTKTLLIYSTEETMAKGYSKSNQKEDFKNT